MRRSSLFIALASVGTAAALACGGSSTSGTPPQPDAGGSSGGGSGSSSGSSSGGGSGSSGGGSGSPRVPAARRSGGPDHRGAEGRDDHVPGRLQRGPAPGVRCAGDEQPVVGHRS